MLFAAYHQGAKFLVFIGFARLPINHGNLRFDPILKALKIPQIGGDRIVAFDCGK